MTGRNLSQRERVMLTATVAAAFLACAYLFVCEPLYNKWKGLDEEIRKKRLALLRAERVLASRDLIEERYAAYQKFFAGGEMSEEETSALMLSAIEKLGSSASVAIINIKPLNTKYTDQFTKFTIRITTESSLTGLVKFVYDLQSSDQLLKVERMTLRAKERQPDVIRGTLHITKISLTK